jgi:hypothetical protein
MRYLRQMGLMDRLAGERPLELSVAESASEKTLPRMIEVGRALKDEDGANAIVMGCAGMARHRRPLENGAGRAGDRSHPSGRRHGHRNGASANPIVPWVRISCQSVPWNRSTSTPA